jgi:anti-sigma regulatory factor (Ser/Thr protein kinase)
MARRSEEILSLDLPCDPSAPGTVRDALGELQWLGWLLGDVTLVASELVANAVTHSGGRPEDRLEFSAAVGAGRLRIAVRDPGLSKTVAQLRESGGIAEGGWGLLIVEQLCEDWGYERDSGNCVWADVRLPPEQNGGPPLAGRNDEPPAVA